MTVVALAEASDGSLFGGKASSLARAIGVGLPAPDGFAVAWETVDRVAAGDAAAIEAVVAAFRRFGAAVAVRSSAVGEDSLDASFAGQHVSILNVTREAMLVEAVRSVHASAMTESALAYRRKMGVAGDPRIAVVLQRMIDADVAGVLFTRDPVTGVDERVVECAWGLGEAVVSGIVTPDRFRIHADGTIAERAAGTKDIMIRFAPEGGTAELPVPAADVARLCLDDAQLGELHLLASQCEEFYGGPQDIEFAFAGGRLVLLQSRPITCSAGFSPRIDAVGLKPDPQVGLKPDLRLRRFAGLALAALLAPLNSTIIAVALPSIATSFDTSPAVATRWVVTAYLVVTIVAQSPAGKMADLFGTSRVLTLGRAAFAAGALLGAFSPALPVLGAARVLMAIGGALSIPTVFAELRTSVPHERRGRIFGIFGAIMSGAAAAGPIIGGFLTDRFGWHSIFVVNVPVVLLSFLLEPPRRSEARATREARFDILGSGILGLAMLLLVAAVDRANLLMAGGAVAMLAAFVARELRTDDPVLDVRLFRRPAFAAGSSIIGLQNLALYSLLFLLPFFLARAGSGPAAAGQKLLLFTVSMVVASPIGGRLSDSLGARIVAFSGAIIAAAGATLFVARGELLTSVILMGAGIGISTGPSQAAALSAVPASQAGVASGALSTMRYAGGVIGSGLVALLAGAGVARDPRLLVFPIVLFLAGAAALALPGRHVPSRM